MGFWHDLTDVFLHLDSHLTEWAERLGPWYFVLLFAIVFCETGLVVTPFLPGDSLLFAVGALVAVSGSFAELAQVILLLSAAAFLGDALNYGLGLRFGESLARRGDTWFFKRAH